MLKCCRTDRRRRLGRTQEIAGRRRDCPPPTSAVARTQADELAHLSRLSSRWMERATNAITSTGQCRTLARAIAAVRAFRSQRVGLVDRPLGHGLDVAQIHAREQVEVKLRLLALQRTALARGFRGFVLHGDVPSGRVAWGSQFEDWPRWCRLDTRTLRCWPAADSGRRQVGARSQEVCGRRCASMDAGEFACRGLSAPRDHFLRGPCPPLVLTVRENGYSRAPGPVRAGMPADVLRADCERTGAQGAAQATLEVTCGRYFHMGEGSFRCGAQQGDGLELRASARVVPD